MSPPIFALRLPEDLKSLLRKEAAKEGRSLTKEIVRRLEKSLEQTNS